MLLKVLMYSNLILGNLIISFAFQFIKTMLKYFTFQNSKFKILSCVVTPEFGIWDFALASSCKCEIFELQAKLVFLGLKFAIPLKVSRIGDIFF